MYTGQGTLAGRLGPPGSEGFRLSYPSCPRKNWEVRERHVEILKEGELMKSLTMEDRAFFCSDADFLNRVLIFSSVFY